MSADPIRLAVIIGSTREGRFGPVIANWFVRQVAMREDFVVDLVDLAEVEWPPVHPKERTAAVAAYATRIAEADAIVVVTPEYNHSFPASLKHAIDLLHSEWQRKPVGFVSYGGLSGGLRAVEHLRQVFAEVHAATMRDAVSFHQPWPQFDEHGELRDPAAAEAAAKVLLDQLGWWGLALRNARRAWPD